MRRFKFLLRPGWLALVLVVLAFSGSCFLVLSPWQFGRNAERQQRNSAIVTSINTPAVPFARLLAPGVEPSQGQLWRKVTATGHYLTAKETVARLRSHGGGPAYEVLTPFRTVGGTLLLVDRGWVAANNGHVPSYPEAPRGTVRITARVQADEASGGQGRPPLRADRHTQVYRIDGATIGSVVGLHFRPGYFQLVAGQPGVLAPIPLPNRDSGPFFSYALQWIVFGVMALVGLGYFTARELKPGGALTPDGRRRRRAEKVERAAGSGTDAGKSAKPPRGRHAVAAAIAEEEAEEEAEDGGKRPTLSQITKS